jgi:hypothetical protein
VALVIPPTASHGERDHVRAVYNHAEFLVERIVMMQEWSDYLDILRRSSRSGHMPSPGAGAGAGEHKERTRAPLM